MQHIWLVGRSFEKLFGARENDLCEHVDGKHGLSGQEDVEKPGYIAVFLYVVCVHGKGAGEGKEWFGLREVGAKGGRDRVDDGGNQV